MPVIVAFGDSNTWGYDPATGGRFPRAQRWPSVSQRELGADFEVIAEGLNGRTTVHDDPIEPYRCGADALPPCLMSHAPVDLVILSLGCNDLKKRFSVSAFDIAEGAGRLIFLARAYGKTGTDARRKSSWSPRPRSPSSRNMRKCSRAARKSRFSWVSAIATSRSAKALRSSTLARSFGVRISTASTTRSISMNCSAALWRRRFKEPSPLLWFP